MSKGREGREGGDRKKRERQQERRDGGMEEAVSGGRRKEKEEEGGKNRRRQRWEGRKLGSKEVKIYTKNGGKEGKEREEYGRNKE